MKTREPAALVAEVPEADEDHCRAPLVAGGEHLGVPDGAARLHEGGRAGVREQTEHSEATTEPARNSFASSEERGFSISWPPLQRPGRTPLLTPTPGD